MAARNPNAHPKLSNPSMGKQTGTGVTPKQLGHPVGGKGTVSKGKKTGGKMSRAMGSKASGMGRFKKSPSQKSSYFGGK